MNSNWLGTMALNCCLSVLVVTSVGGCFVREDGRHVDVVDAHGYHHEGYYDDHHDWHGGYYDENHQFHDDPHDWQQ